MSETRRGFMRRIRTRLRLAWFVATTQRFAPPVAIAVVIALAIGWLTSFPHRVAIGGAVVIAFVLVLALFAVAMPISEWDAARAAERGLRARDALTSALEFTDVEDGVHMLIQQNADALASESRPSDAVPIGADKTRLRQLAMAGTLALLMGIVPPLGSEPALSSDLASAIDAEAERLERLADAVKDADVETSDQIVDELDRLAEELRHAETLEAALESLEASEKRLQSQMSPEFLSEKAAVQGLARDLALRPLVGEAPLDAGSQLHELADRLESLSEPELAALEDRLADLAASQAAGNPTMSGQLTEAARMVSAGDLAAAASAIRQAAAGQETGLSEARGQQAIAETERALEGARARLDVALAGANANTGGMSQSEGDGQAQGPGNGGTPKGGGAAGAISGVAPGDGNAAGQGGQGTVGPPTAADHGSQVGTASVFDPGGGGNISDVLQVSIDGGVGDGDIVGRADAPTQVGRSVVPYAQVLPDYLNEAADALDQLQLPPSMRGIVQTYFDLLADEAS